MMQRLKSQVGKPRGRKCLLKKSPGAEEPVVVCEVSVMEADAKGFYRLERDMGQPENGRNS